MSLPLNEGWGSEGVPHSVFAMPDMNSGWQTTGRTSRALFFKAPRNVGTVVWSKVSLKCRLWEEIDEAMALDPDTICTPLPDVLKPTTLLSNPGVYHVRASPSPHLCSCSQSLCTNIPLLKTQESYVWTPVQTSHPSHLWLKKNFFYCGK